MANLSAPKAHTEGFSTRTFVPGSLFGVRSFCGCAALGHYSDLNVFIQDSEHPVPELHSSSYPVAWKPGWNEALCLRFGRIGSLFSPSHPVASKDCTCGFYAFFDPLGLLQTDFSPFTPGASPLGIIEAKGLITAGALGFRASTVRVVALVLPSPIWLTNHSSGDFKFGDVPIFPNLDSATAEFPLSQAPADQQVA